MKHISEQKGSAIRAKNNKRGPKSTGKLLQEKFTHDDGCDQNFIYLSTKYDCNNGKDMTA